MATNPGSNPARSFDLHLHKSSTVLKEISTVGCVFENGSLLELVRVEGSEDVSLLLCDGPKLEISRELRIGEKTYIPLQNFDAALGNVALPGPPRTYGSLPNLVSCLRDLIKRFSGLTPEYCGLIARFILSTWIIEKLPSCPRLHLMGPRSRTEKQLMTLLASLCRHPLTLARVDLKSTGSLLLEFCSTLILHQRQFTQTSRQMLDAFADRGGLIAPGGRYVRNECAIVTSSHRCEDLPTAPVTLPIPMALANQNVSLLSMDEQRRIASEFQSQLLQYRLDVISERSCRPPDSWDLSFPACEIQEFLAVVTPGDTELKEELRSLIENMDRNFRLMRSSSIEASLIEALLAHLHGEGEQRNYVGDIAESVNAIRAGRGEHDEIEARAVGPLLRSLGIPTSRRDSNGVPVVLTDAAASLIHQLARSFGVPSSGSGRNCRLCALP